jgi:hypothetical protein
MRLNASNLKYTSLLQYGHEDSFALDDDIMNLPTSPCFVYEHETKLLNDYTYTKTLFCDSTQKSHSHSMAFVFSQYQNAHQDMSWLLAEKLRLESYPGKEWVTSENKTVGILYMCRVVCPCSPIMSAQRSLVFTTWSSYVGFQRICSLPPSVFILSPSYSSSCEDTKSKRARTDVLLLSCRKSKPSTSAFMSSHTSILDSKTGSSVPDEHVSLFLRKHCSKHWCWPSQECWMQRYMTALLPPQVQYTLIAKTRSSSSV